MISSKKSQRFYVVRGFLLVLLPTLLSCATAKPPVKVDPWPPIANSLDSRYFHSPVGDIAGHFPESWLLVNTEVLPEFQNVLFLYTNRARVDGLVLSEIPGSAELRRNVERDGLSSVAKAAFDLKLQKSSGRLKLSREPEAFSISNKVFVSYEYSVADSTGTRPDYENRAVVFTTGVRFYELAMIELAPSEIPAEVRKTENFRLLQSVIGQLEGAAELRKMETKPEAAP